MSRPVQIINPTGQFESLRQPAAKNAMASQPKPGETVANNCKAGECGRRWSGERVKRRGFLRKLSPVLATHKSESTIRYCSRHTTLFALFLYKWAFPRDNLPIPNPPKQSV
jgi:hypothetical protein